MEYYVSLIHLSCIVVSFILIRVYFTHNSNLINCAQTQLYRASFADFFNIQFADGMIGVIVLKVIIY